MSSTATRTASSGSERHASMKDISEDIKQLKTDVADGVAHAAEKGVESVRQGADAAVAATKRVTEKASEAHESMCKYVKQNPTTSVLIALGVGALASRLLARR